MRRFIVLFLAGFGIVLALQFMGGFLDWSFLQMLSVLVIALSAIGLVQILLSEFDAAKGWEQSKQALAFFAGCVACAIFIAVGDVTFERRPVPREVSEEQRAESERRRQECIAQHRSGEWVDEQTRQVCELLYVLD